MSETERVFKKETYLVFALLMLPCAQDLPLACHRQVAVQRQSGLWLIYKDGFNPVATKTRPPHQVHHNKQHRPLDRSLQHPVLWVRGDLAEITVS